MAIPNEQLRHILHDLEAAFSKNPHIRVIPLEGDPPEKYEIRYTILGLTQNEEGDIVQTRNHAVHINIPFGFPHFPPSCTPQTRTFHPDFDQDAICIGEFWNKDRRLNELIIHIGKMISGEMYSRGNVFNDTALAWYRKIDQKLPFEKIDCTWPALDKAGNSDTAVNTQLPPGLDILEDEDFASGDYLDDDFVFEAPGQKQKNIPSPKSPANRIQLLIRQKRYHELSIFLNGLAAKDRTEDVNDIEENVASVLENAHKLQSEAADLEHRGNPQEALELYQRVARLVPDFPDIEEHIERNRNSIDFSNDNWATGKEVEIESAEPGHPQTELLPEEFSRTKSRKRVAFFEETTRTTIKYLPLLGGVIAMALAAVFIAPFFTATSHLEKSRRLYGDCVRTMAQGSFEKARSECDEALATIKKITIYKKNERAALLKEIKHTLNSEEMAQGLSGRVFFQGKYIEKDVMARLFEFEALKEEADTLYNKSLWLNAVDTYRTALKNASPVLKNIEEDRLNEISNRISIAEIHISVDKGSSLMSEGDLEKSHEILESALRDAQALPEEPGRDLTAAIEPKLHEIEYLQHLNLGKKYFNADDWESAVKQYEKALRLRTGSSLAGSAYGDAGSLYANMAEAELFSFIAGAKKAFSEAELNMAIDKYQKAIALLESKHDLLQRINPEEIRQHLQRIILRIRIVQFKQMADEHLQSEQYTEAISVLEDVIAAVTSDKLQDDMEFRALIEGTRQTITETRRKATSVGRIEYLISNYKEIFKINYSAAIPEYLSDPKATFIRFIGGKELYELQCLETNRGRKLRLIILYLYDPKTETWQFYSEPG